MAMIKYKLGKNGKLFYGVAGSVASHEVPGCKDVTVKCDTEFINVTNRDSGGMKAEQAALNTCEVSFEILERTDNSAFIEAIETAWGAGNPVALMALHKENGRGPDADFAVTFERGEPIGDAVTHKITAKNQNWRTWHKG